MSSKSSNSLRKKPTEHKSSASSSVSKNQTEEGPKNSGALNSLSEKLPHRQCSSTSYAQAPAEYSQHQVFNNPSERDPPRVYSSTSYAQTPAEYSQYQTINLNGLPSPHSWPSEDTLPSQEQMGYDLLGLGYEATSCSEHFAVAPGCPYHETFLESGLKAWQTGRDLSVMDRWMLEDGSGSGVMFVRGDTGRMITDRGSCCALMQGLGFDMVNRKES